MSESLIEISKKSIGGEAVQTVNARELHAFLGNQMRFNDWIRKRIRDYGFVEGSDYIRMELPAGIALTKNGGELGGLAATQKNVALESMGYESFGQQGRIEYAVTLDMAKELAMVERNEKGREVRRYFIACEKRLLEASFTDAAIAALLLPAPLPWEKRFSPDYYKALARVTGLEYSGHAQGTPALFGQITDEWVYRAMMPAEVYQAMKDRKKSGDKLHQWLTDGGLESLDSRIKAVTMIANSSANLHDFKARCQLAFGLPGQLRIVYPLAA